MLESDFSSRQFDQVLTTFNSTDDLFDMTVDAVVQTNFVLETADATSAPLINPFTGESVIAQLSLSSVQIPINPWIVNIVESVQEKFPTEIVEAPKKLDQEAAYATFKKYYNQIESANKILAQHALVCNGDDGHKKPEVALTNETFSFIQNQTFDSIMSTDIGKKIAAAEELTIDEEKQLIEMSAKQSDEILGTDTLSVIQKLSEYEDFSWEDGDASRLIVEQANAGHTHSAECGHGGGPDITGLSYKQSFGFESSGRLFSAMNSGHEHHNKLVVCPHCSFKKVAHVHGSEGPKCGRCGKGKMKVSSKRS